MLSLQLFGGVSLLDESGPVTGPATQRRRLALLARLAVAPNGSISRDKLIACFWPEEDRERARHHLADSVFTLRRHLGKDLVLTVGDDLILNRDQMDCDVWRFHAALEGGDRERAVALYSGPFLDGFFVADAPEVERWVEDERVRLARLHATALEQLAEEMEGREEHAAAVHWWRRLATEDPFSSRVALRLMQALGAAGDRAAAVQHAKVHAALLDGEMGLAPDPQVQAFAARLAAAPEATAPVMSPPPEAPAPAMSPPPQAPLTLPPDAAGAPPPSRATESVPPPVNHRPRRRSRRVVLVPLLAIAGLASLSMWRSARLNGSNPAASGLVPAEVTTIAVMPFSFQGTPDGAYLGEGLPTLLSTSLDGAGELRTVDHNVVLSQALVLAESGRIAPADAGELAERLEAELFILGTVVESAGRFTIVVTLYRAGAEPTAVRRVTVEGSDPGELVDDVSRKLLVEELSSHADRLSRLAVLTTPSLPALKAYLKGDQEFRAARYPQAVAALQLAVREDPLFALAHYRLSTAAAWNFQFTEARRAADDALRLAKHLTDRDRRLVMAWHGLLNGDWELAEHLYNTVLAEDPNDVEAWSGLGEVRAHYNALHGEPADESVYAFQQVLELAPKYGEARFHLLEFAARRGDRLAVDTLLAGVEPDSPQLLAWQAAREFSWGTSAGVDSISRSLREADDVIVGVAAARSAVHFGDIDAGESLARLLTRPGRPAPWQAAGHIMIAQGALARGDWVSARADLDASMEVDRGWALEIRALGALLPDASVNEEELRQVRTELQEWDPREMNPEMTFFFGTHADVHAELRLYLIALLSLHLGDDEMARQYRDAIPSTGRGPSSESIGASLRRSVDAHQAERSGDAALALRLLEGDRLRAPLERIALSPFYAQALDRYLRANVLASLGRHEEALRWYASLSDGPDLLFRAPAHERQSELLARMGRLEDARSQAEQARAVRSRHGPPPFLVHNR